jgi:hypothetical protein
MKERRRRGQFVSYVCDGGRKDTYIHTSWHKKIFLRVESNQKIRKDTGMKYEY